MIFGRKTVAHTSFYLKVKQAGVCSVKVNSSSPEVFAAAYITNPLIITDQTKD